jgi:hypothetical protein
VVRHDEDVAANGIAPRRDQRRLLLAFNVAGEERAAPAVAAITTTTDKTLKCLRPRAAPATSVAAPIETMIA